MLFRKYATVVIKKGDVLSDSEKKNLIGSPSYLADYDLSEYDLITFTEEIPVIENIVKEIKKGIKKEGFVRDTEYCIEAYIITDKDIDVAIDYILSKGRRRSIFKRVQRR